MAKSPAPTAVAHEPACEPGSTGNKLTSTPPGCSKPKMIIKANGINLKNNVIDWNCPAILDPSKLIKKTDATAMIPAGIIALVGKWNKLATWVPKITPFAATLAGKYTTICAHPSK